MIVADHVVTEKESDHREIESIKIRDHQGHHVNHEDIDIEEDQDHDQHHLDHHEVHIQDQDRDLCHIHDHVHHREVVIDHEEVQDHGDRGAGRLRVS